MLPTYREDSDENLVEEPVTENKSGHFTFSGKAGDSSKRVQDINDGIGIELNEVRVTPAISLPKVDS